jgi:hypothetical protein
MKKRAHKGLALRRGGRAAAARPLPDDVALLTGPTEDGEGARLLRLQRGALYAGEVRPAREGQPLGGQELVRLRPMPGRGPLCEVEVLHAPEAAPAGDRSGPARIATDRYRRNWNAVFGAGSTGRSAASRKKPSELN